MRVWGTNDVYAECSSTTSTKATYVFASFFAEFQLLLAVVFMTTAHMQVTLVGIEHAHTHTCSLILPLIGGRAFSMVCILEIGFYYLQLIFTEMLPVDCAGISFNGRGDRVCFFL